MIFRLILQNRELIASRGIFTYLGWLFSSSLSSFPCWLYKVVLVFALLVFAAFKVPVFMNRVEGAFPEKMTMFMEFLASERNVFVVDGLGPVLVMIFKYYGSRDHLGYVQVHTNARIRGVPPLLGGFGRLNIYAYGVTYAGKDLLQP